MAYSPTLSHVVLVITAGVLFYAALVDFKEFKIRNEVILILIGLFVVHAFLSGRWLYAYWNLALAAVVLVVMLYFYAQGWMGGGDVKIMAVGFLWIGFDCALVFAAFLLIFAIVQAVAAKLGWGRVHVIGDQKRIPFAPTVAGAMIVCFMLGCLQPISLLTYLKHLQ